MHKYSSVINLPFLCIHIYIYIYICIFHIQYVDSFLEMELNVHVK